MANHNYSEGAKKYFDEALEKRRKAQAFIDEKREETRQLLEDNFSGKRPLIRFRPISGIGKEFSFNNQIKNAIKSQLEGIGEFSEESIKKLNPMHLKWDDKKTSIYVDFSKHYEKQKLNGDDRKREDILDEYLNQLYNEYRKMSESQEIVNGRFLQDGSISGKYIMEKNREKTIQEAEKKREEVIEKLKGLPNITFVDGMEEEGQNFLGKSPDSYGDAISWYAENFSKLIQNDIEKNGETLEESIKNAQSDLEYFYDISYMQLGTVVNLLSQCWKYGAELKNFYKAKYEQ